MVIDHNVNGRWYGADGEKELGICWETETPDSRDFRTEVIKKNKGDYIHWYVRNYRIGHTLRYYYGHYEITKVKTNWDKWIFSVLPSWHRRDRNIPSYTESRLVNHLSFTIPFLPSFLLLFLLSLLSPLLLSFRSIKISD